MITLSNELQRADKGIVGFLKSLTITNTDRANIANRKHGFTSRYGAMILKSDYYAEDECWSPYGYASGLPGRAWSLKSYKVLKLLVDQGFSKMSFSIRDQFYDAEKLSYEREEIEVVKLFLENGRLTTYYDLYFQNYPDNKIIQFL